MDLKFTWHENKFVKKLYAEHEEIYIRLRKNIEANILDFIATYIRYFTSHGRKHSEGIIRQISYMIPDDEFNNLSSTEICVLLCSIWLHDIGLLVNRYPDTRRELNDKEIREEHHILSKKIILKHHGDFGISDPHIADLIANIAYCHRKKDKNGKDIEIRGELKKSVFLGKDKIRPQLLAALLRLGDAMDTNWRRAPEMIMSTFSTFPDESNLHWIACKMTEVGYDHNNKYIYVNRTTNIDNPNKLNEKSLNDIFFWKYHDIRKEFKSVERILTENHIEFKDVLTFEKKKKPKDIEIILLESELDLCKQEKVSSADVYYRIARFYEKKIVRTKKESKERRLNKKDLAIELSKYFGESEKCFKEASKYMQDARKTDNIKKFNFGRYFYNFLENYFEIKSKAQEINKNLLLKNKEKTKVKLSK
ncbi:MAG TPA: hypothetical protein ENH01_04225 [Nitrospirae bacterium]|nr:hypothetical protein [Nitrospirota bacterium]